MTYLLLATTAFGAGFLAGAMNAIAGGGTFITFAGGPPILANTTASLTQFPGYVTSALAYKSEIERQKRGADA